MDWGFFTERWPHTVTFVNTIDNHLNLIKVNDGGKIQIQNGGVFANGTEPSSWYPKLDGAILVEAGGELELLAGLDANHRTWFSNRGTLTIDAASDLLPAGKLSLWSHTVLRNCGTLTNNGTTDYHGGQNGEIFQDCNGITTIGSDMNINGSGACILIKNGGLLNVINGKTLSFSNGGFLAARTNSTVIVDDNSTLQLDATSGDNKIDPGSILKFGAFAQFVSNKAIIIEGTSTSPITFTSAKSTPAAGDWVGLKLYTAPSILKYCNIRYAQDGVRANMSSGSGGLTVELCEITNSSSSGIYAYNSLYYGALYIKGTKLNNNNTGLYLFNTWASVGKSGSVVTEIANNSNTGFYAFSSSYVYMANTLIHNNTQWGLYADGNSTAIYGSPNGTSPGYNSIYNNTNNQIVKYNGSAIQLGVVWTYCDCGGISSVGIPLFNEKSIFSTGGCSPGCDLVTMSSGGYNTIYGNGYWVKNMGTGTAYADLTTWGNPAECPPSSSKFYGTVSRNSPLGCEGSGSSAKIIPGINNVENSMYGFEVSALTDSLKALRYIFHLISLIDDSPDSAGDAIAILSSFVGPLGKYSQVMNTSWETYLSKIESKSKSGRLRKHATIYKIQQKMERKEYSDAIALAERLAERTPDDDTWLYCQSQIITANVLSGNNGRANQIYQNIVSRGLVIDSSGTDAMGRMLNAATGISINGISTTIARKNEEGTKTLPKLFQLHNNYPNPFNPVTKIEYDLPELAHVSLIIYDVLGREISTLVDEFQDAGYKSVKFDAVALPSGVYFYKIQANPASGQVFTNIKKMLLVR